MDNTLLTALITGGSACMGALIASLFSYLSMGKQNKFDRNSKLEEIRILEYKEYLDSIQKLVNDGTSWDNYYQFKLSSNRLMLFAGSELCKNVTEYCNKLERTVIDKGFSFNQKDAYTSILNAMRKEIGVTKEELKDVNFTALPH